MKILGGRPMKREGIAFIDSVSRESVCYYRDTNGKLWLATGPWALFRVEANEPTNPDAEAKE